MGWVGRKAQNKGQRHNGGEGRNKALQMLALCTLWGPDGNKHSSTCTRAHSAMHAATPPCTPWLLSAPQMLAHAHALPRTCLELRTWRQRRRRPLCSRRHFRARVCCCQQGLPSAGSCGEAWCAAKGALGRGCRVRLWLGTGARPQMRMFCRWQDTRRCARASCTG